MPGAWAAGAGLAVAILAALGLLLTRRRFVLVTVEGASMEPAYRQGDRVLVRRARLSAVRRGQVVVVANPAAPPARPSPQAPAWAARRRWMIKRAAAVPGDPVPPELAAALGAVPGTAVPAGRLVVLGDNGKASVDSRRFGYVTADGVVGVVARRLPSAGELGRRGGRRGSAGASSRQARSAANSRSSASIR
jgi:signal peptidase I